MRNVVARVYSRALLLALIAALGVSAPAAGAGGDLAGYWSTQLTEHGLPLTVTFSFAKDAKGGYSARFSSETQAFF